MQPQHGVLGVECSNHSVPTILFNDLAERLPVRLFHAWGLLRGIIPTSSSIGSALAIDDAHRHIDPGSPSVHRRSSCLLFHSARRVLSRGSGSSVSNRCVIGRSPMNGSSCSIGEAERPMDATDSASGCDVSNSAAD